MEPESEISPEMQCLIEEDEQFWSYKDVVPNEEGELLQWNKQGPQKMAIFDWLPWGVPGSYREVEVLSVQLLNHQDGFVWRLSEPQVRVLELGEIKQSFEVRLLPLSYYKEWERSKGGVNFLRTVDMSSSYQTTGDSY